MLTIFCGDNTVKSRESYISSQSNLAKNGYKLVQLHNAGLAEELEGVNHNQSLFDQKIAYIGENLLAQKKNRDLFSKLSTQSEILLWEERTDPRTLEYAFKNAKVNKFDLPSNIWKLLDGMYPGNKNFMIENLKLISDSGSQEVQLLLFMLQRRAKELLLVKANYTVGKRKLADWQLRKIKQQRGHWDDGRITEFYKKLYTIEVSSKSAGTPYTTSQALEILFCFYL